MTSASININEVTGKASITFRVIGVRKFSLRLKALSATLKIAEWISPLPFVVEYSDVAGGLITLEDGVSEFELKKDRVVKNYGGHQPKRFGNADFEPGKATVEMIEGHGG